MSAFLHSKNFKSRTISAIMLLVIGGIGLLTPNMDGFRILFGAAGTMACIEFLIVTRNKMQIGEIIDDRFVVFEVVILAFGTLVVVVSLHPEEIILVLLAAIANDTFAYFTGNLFHGSIFGKKRPFPRVSPNKSWEGLIGGYFGAVIATFAFLVTWKYAHSMHNLEKMLFNYTELNFILFAPAFAILGDYLESFTKRCLGLKDSNEYIVERKIPILSQFELLMTGHGGFADRLDSWVVVAILMFILKTLPT